MRNRITQFVGLCLLALSNPFFVHAQNCGLGNRFRLPVFSQNPTTTTVNYGRNVNLSGQQQSLNLDIYQPVGDTLALRPLVIWAFGGSFTAGVRQSPDLVRLSNDLGRKGYVCASIDYRLGVPEPRSKQVIFEAVIRGVHDMKAAIRYFRKTIFDEGNPYRVDPDQIFVGGVSAGGIIATHVAYVDNEQELSDFGLDTSLSQSLGGLEGLSGNPGYSSAVKGVINISGALGEAEWIAPGDPFIISLHGDRDNTVPYGTKEVTTLGRVGLIIDGSYAIDSFCQTIGHPSHLYTYVNQGHVPFIRQDILEVLTLGLWVSPLIDSTESFISNNLSRYIDCQKLVTSRPELRPLEARVYPNPATDYLKVELPADVVGAVSARLIDLAGRELLYQTTPNANSSTLTLPLGGLSPGLYILEARAGERRVYRNVIVQPQN